MNRTLTAAALLALSTTAPALAVSYSIDWLNLSPTAIGSQPPSGGFYNLPGVGAVQMTYTSPPGISTIRGTLGNFFNGNVTSGPDTYSWTSYEHLGRTNLVAPPPLNQSWDVTYTFPSTMAAGSIVLTVSGLGRRDSINGGTPGAVSTATVLQNGTFFGDWPGFPAPNFGATQFNPGVGIFSLENSVTGAGGIDPWWNTQMAVVRIDDVLNSLTVRFNHTSGDGINVNIGYINPVPAPAAAAVLGMGGLVLTRRRR